MKATLEFNLPEESDDFTLATKGPVYYSIISEIVEYFRNKLKYCEYTQEEGRIMEGIQKDILDIVGSSLEDVQ